MLRRITLASFTPALALLALHCGSAADEAAPIREAVEGDAPSSGLDSTAPELVTPPSVVIEPSDGHIRGEVSSSGTRVEFAATRSTPFAGAIAVQVGSLAYELEYDYEARQVVTDGHGGAIDRAAQRALGEALRAAADVLGPNDPSVPLHQQMLFAALALLEESGGMPLPRMSFPLSPVTVDKSLENDGVTCIERGVSYPVSFDYGDRVVLDEPVSAGVDDCNGQCGPGCARLTPFLMWTFDCLEHDRCCRETSIDPCWTPLGECGDEYVDASGDFLKGFDPFGTHCGG